MGELDNWDGGFINKIEVPKDAAKNKEKWYIKYWNLIAPDLYESVNEIVPLEN